MAAKPFSEIRADPELLKKIEDRAASGEGEWPDSVVEDATSSAEVPELESDEAKTFIRAVATTFGLPHSEEQERGNDAEPTEPPAA